MIARPSLFLAAALLSSCVTSRPDSGPVTRRPSSLDVQRAQCEMNSSQLVLVMTGNAGHIAAGHEADGRFHHPQEIADFVRSNPTGTNPA
ncbi:MAG: hypothetical protein KF767_03965 [Bdellovibrionaceae bacterium]|nr:hypothetical protein [Pseudobdellovibrionaceae bacterium]